MHSVQAKIELETEQRDKTAAVSKMQLESQGQVEQQQELERELEKSQAESERLRTEADATQKLLYQQIEELRNQMAGDTPMSPVSCANMPTTWCRVQSMTVTY